MDIKELESGVDPATHWYYQSKKIPLLNFIRKITGSNQKLNLIDIGAGSGFFSEEVNTCFPETIQQSILVDTAYTLSEIEGSRKGKMKKQHHLPEQLHNSLVLLMDVLEHLPDDLLMLKNIRQNAMPGIDNYFFITVPAFQSIWSGHDVYLEHYRRYTKTSLLKVLNEAGYKTNKIYYLYGSLFPLVFLKRKLGNVLASKKDAPVSDMKPLPFWLNALLLKYAGLEMLLTRYNTLFGLTCVAEGEF